ncbi:MAG: hypothetical protein HYX94_13580 [Chloroflexi bacterium]|nr:hypothetical protein [Chloroflexota bacterium]
MFFPADVAFPTMNYYHSTKTLYKNIKNAKLDELIDKVLVTSDAAEQKRLATEAAVLAQQEYTFLRIISVYRVVGYTSKIGSVPPYVQSVGIPGEQLQLITRAK